MPLTAIVVGAGEFGTASARELVRRGHAVTLLDPGPIPHPLAASTDTSKVVRLDYGADVVDTELAERALDGWRAWSRAWRAEGRRNLFHEDGWLLLTRTQMRPGGFEHDSFALLRSRGHDPRRLDSATLAAEHPLWRQGLHVDGYLNPEGGWAESGAVVGWLAERCRAEGVTVEQGVGLEAWCGGGGERVTIARTGNLRESAQERLPPGPVMGVVGSDGRRRPADVVLLAAGAWTPFLLPHLADVLAPVGQPVFHFRPADPAAFAAPRFRPWAADMTATGYYGLPLLPDGTVKVARHGKGRRLHPEDSRDVPPAELAACRAFLREALPALAEAELVAAHTCLYCDSPDGRFWIDHDPERPGLVVASGDSGHAFKFAPVLGALIADVVERRPDRYGGRFAWRAAASAAGTIGDAARQRG